MGRQNRGKTYERRARDRALLDHFDTGFMPTLSIVMPIMLLDGKADALEDHLATELKRNRKLKSDQKRFFRVIEAERMELKVVEGEAIKQSLQQAGVALSVNGVRNAAYESQRKISALHRAPHEFRVPLGFIAVNGKQNDRISIETRGWRGRRARVARKNLATKIYSPTGMLLEMGDICLDALADNLPAHKQSALDSVDTRPRIDIVEKIGDPISRRDFGCLESKLEELRPDDIVCGNPMIKMELGDRVERLPVIPQIDNVFQLRRAA